MRKRIDYRRWLKHLLICDSILPIIAIVLPLLFQLFFKAQDQRLTLVIVATAVALAFVRARIGLKVIRSDACSATIRGFQRIFLIAAVIWMLFVDQMFMIVGTLDTWRFLEDVFPMILIAYAVYLLPMFLATYPGRTLDTVPQTDGDFVNPWMR